jgi:hypothetical protein
MRQRRAASSISPMEGGSVDKTCYVPANGSPEGEMNNCET